MYAMKHCSPYGEDEIVMRGRGEREGGEGGRVIGREGDREE